MTQRLPAVIVVFAALLVPSGLFARVRNGTVGPDGGLDDYHTADTTERPTVR